MIIISTIIHTIHNDYGGNAVKGKVNVKRYFQTLGICLAVLLVGVLAALGFGFWDTADEGLTADEIATVAIADGKINVLLMGVDEGGLRTDCIMVASYDIEKKTAKLLSIPRDTRIFIGSRYQKVNAAHALRASNGGILGAQGTVEAVTRMTGIPINYYVELPFSAVEECIDLLGPITFEVPDIEGGGRGMVYDDPVQDLHINLKAGVQELSGEQCVHLLRYRKGNVVNGRQKGYQNGDIERIGVQQEFLKALIDQKLNASLILKIPAMFKQLSGSLKTNLSVKDVVVYSKYLSDFKSANLETFSLPGNFQTIDSVSYWECDLEATRQLIRSEFGYDANNITVDKVSKSESGDNDSASKKTAKPAATKKPNTATTVAPTKKPASQKTQTPVRDEDADKTATPTKAPTKAPTKEPTKAPTKAPEKEDSSDAPVSTKIPTKGTEDE